MQSVLEWQCNKVDWSIENADFFYFNCLPWQHPLRNQKRGPDLSSMNKYLPIILCKDCENRSSPTWDNFSPAIIKKKEINSSKIYSSFSKSAEQLNYKWKCKKINQSLYIFTSERSTKNSMWLWSNSVNLQFFTLQAVQLRRTVLTAIGLVNENPSSAPLNRSLKNLSHAITSTTSTAVQNYGGNLSIGVFWAKRWNTTIFLSIYTHF